MNEFGNQKSPRKVKTYWQKLDEFGNQKSQRKGKSYWHLQDKWQPVTQDITTVRSCMNMEARNKQVKITASRLSKQGYSLTYSRLRKRNL